MSQLIIGGFMYYLQEGFFKDKVIDIELRYFTDGTLEIIKDKALESSINLNPIKNHVLFGRENINKDRPRTVNNYDIEQIFSITYENKTKWFICGNKNQLENWRRVIKESASFSKNHKTNKTYSATPNRPTPVIINTSSSSSYRPSPITYSRPIISPVYTIGTIAHTLPIVTNPNDNCILRPECGLDFYCNNETHNHNEDLNHHHHSHHHHHHHNNDENCENNHHHHQHNQDCHNNDHHHEDQNNPNNGSFDNNLNNDQTNNNINENSEDQGKPDDSTATGPDSVNIDFIDNNPENSNNNETENNNNEDQPSGDTNQNDQTDYSTNGDDNTIIESNSTDFGNSNNETGGNESNTYESESNDYGSSNNTTDNNTSSDTYVDYSSTAADYGSSSNDYSSTDYGSSTYDYGSSTTDYGSTDYGSSSYDCGSNDCGSTSYD